MALESTVLPLSSEVALIPASSLAQQEKMNFCLIELASTAGSPGYATDLHEFRLVHILQRLGTGL